MNHADPLDQAQAETEQALSHAIAQRTVYTGQSSLYCHRCGEPIPQARRDAVKGCSYCIDCQQIEDIKNRK